MTISIYINFIERSMDLRNWACFSTKDLLALNLSLCFIIIKFFFFDDYPKEVFYELGEKVSNPSLIANAAVKQ